MLGKPTRPGFQTVTPYLIVRELEPMLEFLQSVFGATELFRTTGGSGGTHIELRIGDSIVMISGGENGETMEPMPIMLFLYLEEVDKVYHAALDAGATSLVEPAPMFGEPRGAGIQDASGNQWYFARWEEGPEAPPGYDDFIEEIEPTSGAPVTVADDSTLPKERPKIEPEHFDKALYLLLDETFDNVQGFYLDEGTSLFETLATISAEEASIPVGGKCATLAAQVKHTAFYLDVIENAVRTQNFTSPDWGEIWRETSAVTPEEWETLKSELRSSYERIKALIADNDGWINERRIGSAMAVVAHTAYHLGEIRQALCTIKP